jgi:hypothetical protein
MTLHIEQGGVSEHFQVCIWQAGTWILSQTGYRL